MFGSSGGGGKTSGGGALFINSTSLKLDGSIKLEGKSGHLGSTYGGGSGGSLLIDTGSFSGSGLIQANGGAGGSAGGGGGSGGRIAIHSESYFYTGSITAYGGTSPIEAGAAGTIYKNDKRTGATILEVYNLGRTPLISQIALYNLLSNDSARTWVTNTSLEQQPNKLIVDYADLSKDVFEGISFDEVRLGGGAHLAFEFDPKHLRMIEIRKLVGDYEGGHFGYIHAGPNQFLAIRETNYYIPVNLKVYENGIVHIPNRIMLHKSSLSLEGYLIGVRDLTISECLVNIGSSGSILTRGTPKAAHLDIDSIKILNNGILRMADTMNEYILKSKILELNPGGMILGTNVTILADSMTVHESSHVSFDGQGTRCTPSNVYYAGSGGSHGGYGGLGKTAKNRAEPFDYVYSPMSFGEAGYAGRVSDPCKGGYGGGRLNITVSTTLILDGIISSR